MGYIFTLGTEDDVIFPVTVSHVCRAWRELALFTPPLWRRVCLDGRLRLWTEFIRRARTCTLDIQLVPRNPPTTRTARSPHGRHYLDAQTVQLYMHCVTPYIAHWRSLSIEFQHYAPYLWNATLSACCGQGYSLYALTLERLTLIHPNNDDSKEFALFGGYAPHLRAVTVHGVRLTWLPSLYSNLTFLDYTHHGFTRGLDAASDLLYMLQVSRRLRELRVSFPSRLGAPLSAFYEPFPSDGIVILSHLMKLELRIEGIDLPSAMVHFISHLSIPSLRTLRLLSSNNHTRISHTNDTMPSRLRQLVKAFPRLYSVINLELEHTWLSDARFAWTLLHLVPSLRYLTFRGPYVTNPFLSDMGEVLLARSRPPRSAVLTSLDSLILDRCDNISGGYLTEVVRQKLGGERSCVHSLHVRDCLSVDAAALRWARNAGVSVHVWKKGQRVEISSRGTVRPHR